MDTYSIIILVNIMKYPSGINKTVSNYISYGNRGMSLEDDLNLTNEYYKNNDIAIIYKKPTPITINKVFYPSRKDAVITEAHFKTPSTTDYNGIYKGKYIDFEAKETSLKYFPLSNIHFHQIEHLKKIVKHGGIGFIIVSFTSLNVIYLLETNLLLKFINNSNRKSIPLEYFKKNGHEIKYSYQPRVDYLKIINDLYFKGDVL